MQLGDEFIIKHDQYVIELKRKLEPDYDLILTHVPLYKQEKRKQKLAAEIDLLARKGDHYDIYEVKCSARVTKARKQLSRIKRISLFDIREAFFYCGNSALIIKMQIRGDTLVFDFSHLSFDLLVKLSP